MIKILKKIGFPGLIFIIGFSIPLEDFKGGGSGEVVAKVFIGFGFALGGYFLQTLVEFYYDTIIKNKLGFLKGEKKYLSVILMLAAKVAMADGDVSPSELKIIKKRLYKDFKPADAERYFLEFKSHLESDISLRELGVIIRNEFDESAKSHLMYLLISIATVDGFLSNTELHVIQQITKYGHISTGSYLHIFKTFEFKREQNYREKSQQAGKSKSRTNASILRKAYSLIGVAEGASMEKIKKAYRKLAKIHHPDKVMHLGEVHQTAAKEKFQSIADAYDLIKESLAA